jgi:hypothetical protein
VAGTAIALITFQGASGGGCPSGSQLSVTYSGMTSQATRICRFFDFRPDLELNGSFEPESPGGNVRALILCSEPFDAVPGTYHLRNQGCPDATFFGAAGSPGVYTLCDDRTPTNLITVTAVGMNPGDPVVGSFSAHMCGQTDATQTLDITGTFSLPRDGHGR